MANFDVSAEVKAAFSSQFNNGELSDLIVRCRHREYRVHKVIVCSMSRFFQAACTSGFREAADNIVTLDEDPVLIEEALRFMYRFDYDERNSMTHYEPTQPVVFHVRMYIIADKYDVPALKRAAAVKFKRHVNDWHTGPDELALAIEKIYTFLPSNDRTLRDMVLRRAVHISSQIMDPTNSYAKPIKDVMDRHTSFMRDLLAKVTEELRLSQSWLCDSCIRNDGRNIPVDEVEW